jgi:uncharacterized protein (DUF1330 family)
MDPAYLLTRSHVHDMDSMMAYAALAMPIMERYGAERVTKAQPIVCLDGEYDGARVGIVRFPSTEKLLEFWNCPEYAPVREIRRSACTADLWMIPGLPATKDEEPDKPKVYMMAFNKTTDVEAMRGYAQGAGLLAKAQGAVVLAATNEVVTLDGKAPDHRVVIMRFPGDEAFAGFWNNPEYQPLRAIRLAATSRSDVLLSPGLD